MNKQTVLAGQSLVDKALELTGSVDNLYQLAKANGVSVSDKIFAGQQITASPLTNLKVVQSLAFSNVATAPKSDPVPVALVAPFGFPLNF